MYFCSGTILQTLEWVRLLYVCTFGLRADFSYPFYYLLQLR